MRGFGFLKEENILYWHKTPYININKRLLYSKRCQAWIETIVRMGAGFSSESSGDIKGNRTF